MLAAAVGAAADAIVAGDDDLLVLGEYEGIRVLTVRRFLDLIEAS